MKTLLVNIKRTIEYLNIKIMRLEEYKELSNKPHLNKVLLISKFEDKRDDIMQILNNSKSQYGQDIFSLMQSNFKSHGYFIEIGAADGVSLSNTYLLEKQFHWTGILVEPARIYEKSLRANRNAIVLIQACSKNESPEISFVERELLSTIKTYKDSDFHKKQRRFAREYKVKNSNLNKILETYKSPEIIDFLSLDTEGSEYDILSTINFDKFKFSCICVEHNYTENREKIYDLLTKKGYIRVMNEISLVDDWYLLKK